ncbi:MAG TPA: glucose-6-phosphate isomerase, partial [Thermotogota bacterium]|nr:glucose-6-phosphate isomerase [Thermotogota bacterium]
YYEKGISLSVMMAYSNALYTWADWYRQLWAESLGKRVNRSGQEVFVGPTPIKALGVTDQHSQVQLYNEGKLDKVLTFLEVESFRHRLDIPSMHPEHEGLSYLGNQKFNDLINLELRGTEYALTKHGRPSMRVVFPRIDETHIGEFIVTYEMATTLMAALLDIDPFDQPGVELGKQATYALMGRAGYDALAKEIRFAEGEDS